MPDAHLAVLAFGHGLTLSCTDGDLARFPTLRWENAGKSGSAQNSRGHGLSVPVFADPAQAEDVKALAHAIAGEGVNSEVQEHTCRNSEAHIDLLRVRQARLSQLTGALDDPNYMSLADAHKALVIDQRLYTITPPTLFDFEFIEGLMRKREGAQKFAAILSDSAKELSAFDSFGRRALPRRKFAIRNFDAARRRQLERIAEQQNQLG